MGVSCVVHWKPSEGRNPTQRLELLQSRIETLGGKSLGTWIVDCETLQSSPALGGGGPQKLVHMLHSSEYPLTTFAVLDSNKCLVAENTLDTIFLHLRQFYAQRKGHKVDVKGVHYDLNDKYIVKVGSVVIGSSNKGIIVETEDKHSSESSCWEPLSDFVRGLLQNSAPITSPSFPPRPYATADTMIYYANVFTELRKVGPIIK
ncbi:mediator of RNA polymerase II transcription subunit 20-like [Halichondria panicea]|uniref:mediator of RNA polymerase II transcription subunit 20-like n=1 Tax=Halichondria panicea TaxID=6063 RepID=UPI00312B51B5